MAPTPARTLACLGLVGLLATACTADPAPRSDVAGTTATPSAPASSPGSVPHPPDLSGRTIDCEAIDEPCEPGDDPVLDELWEACAEGHPGACDRLYYDSAFDTRYEQFGNTCGDREARVPCPPDLAPGASAQPTRSRL